MATFLNLYVTLVNNLYLHYPPAGAISSVRVSALLPTAPPPASSCGDPSLVAAHVQVPGADGDTISNLGCIKAHPHDFA